METGTRTATTVPDHGATDVDELATYRPLSALAVASLAIGLAAPLCLVAPLLLAIPLVGIVVAVLAMRQIAESEGALLGRTAAIVGLAICVASIGAALARSSVKDVLLARQAREVGLEWLAQIQAGDVAGAFAMTPEGMRPSKPPEADSEEPSTDPLATFRENPLIAFLISHGSHLQVQYDRDLAPGEGLPSSYSVEQVFVVQDKEHAGEEPVYVALTLNRARVRGGIGWYVAGYRSDSFPPEMDDQAHDHSHHAH